jgi:hypothetical protein
MRRVLRGLAACILVLLGACGTHATRPMNFVADSSQEVSTGGTGTCVVRVRSVEDLRDSASSFGSSANFEQFALHVPEWVTTAVASLDRPKRKLLLEGTEAQGAEPDVLTVTVRIHKAYIQGMATSRTAQIVLSNQYEQSGKALGTKFYRGSDTSVNWSNSADEVETGMNAAMNLALVAMDRDLDRYCAATQARN